MKNLYKNTKPKMKMKTEVNIKKNIFQYIFYLF